MGMCPWILLADKVRLKIAPLVSERSLPLWRHRLHGEFAQRPQNQEGVLEEKISQSQVSNNLSGMRGNFEGLPFVTSLVITVWKSARIVAEWKMDLHVLLNGGTISPLELTAVPFLLLLCVAFRQFD